MKRSNRSYRNAIRTIRDYGRPHRGRLLGGLAGTVAVVSLRLAMPWPLRGVLEMAVDASASTSPTATVPVPESVGLVPLLLAFVVIGAFLGLSEMWQRVQMKRFAADTVRDLRSAAVKGVVRRHGSDRDSEVISRLVGDAARVKAELSGILVHVSQNFLLFAGVCVLFVVIAPILAAFFLASGLFAIGVGYRSTARVQRLTRRQRAKEADYAAVLQDAVQTGTLDGNPDAVNRSSTRRDVAITRTIARSSAIVHTGVAVLTAFALAFAVHGVTAGWLLPGELFLFIAYVLTVHRRLVQVGRQLARSGKMTANVRRIADLARSTEDSGGRAESVSTAIELRNVRLRGSRSTGGRRRLRSIDLTIPAGSRTLIVGGTGTGKSSLLRTIAGLERFKGEMLWDGDAVTADQVVTSGQIAFVPQAPVFRRTPLHRLLGLSPDDPVEPLADVFRACSIRKLVAGAPAGLSTRVSSAALTQGEARGLVLCRLLLSDRAPVWLVDDPFTGSGRRRTRERMATILHRAGARTLIVSARRALSTESFDRIIVLRSGRIKFSGDPDDYHRYRLYRKSDRLHRKAV